MTEQIRDAISSTFYSEHDDSPVIHKERQIDRICTALTPYLAPRPPAPMDAEWAKRANEALAGIDYAMDWKNNSPSAKQFAVGLATARQFVIDAKNTHPQ